jgi:hypothetical protein
MASLIRAIRTSDYITIKLRMENSVGRVIARSEATKQSPLVQVGRLLRFARNDMFASSPRPLGMMS